MNIQFPFSLPPAVLNPPPRSEPVTLALAKEAFCLFYKKKFQVPFSPAEIFITQDFFGFNKILTSHFDHVITSLGKVAKSFQLKVDEYLLESHYQQNSIPHDAKKILIISNPNLFGNLYSKPELKKLLRAAKSNNTVVFSDESNTIYTFDGTPTSTAQVDSENVIVAFSPPINFKHDICFYYIPLYIQKTLKLPSLISMNELNIPIDLLTQCFHFFASSETEHYFQRVNDIIRMHIESLHNRLLNADLAIQTNYPQCGSGLLISSSRPISLPSHSPKKNLSISPWTSANGGNRFHIEIEIKNGDVMLERAQQGWNSPENFLNKLNPSFSEDGLWLCEQLKK